MEESIKALAYNGRYLMMGFASDKTVVDETLIVPRRIALGNFKLCGVLLSYADADRQKMMKEAIGWNLPSDALGDEITRGVVDLVRQGACGRWSARSSSSTTSRPRSGDGEPRDRRPHDREALGRLNAVCRSTSDRGSCSCAPSPSASSPEGPRDSLAESCCYPASSVSPCSETTGSRRASRICHTRALDRPDATTSRGRSGAPSRSRSRNRSGSRSRSLPPRRPAPSAPNTSTSRSIPVAPRR